MANVIVYVKCNGKMQFYDKRIIRELVVSSSSINFNFSNFYLFHRVHFNFYTKQIQWLRNIFTRRCVYCNVYVLIN